MTTAVTRVLVVEDSATQAAALAVLLERDGFTTLVARRAECALERRIETEARGGLGAFQSARQPGSVSGLEHH